MVGTEAALHRVDRADVVAFLDIDQHLLAPRFGAGEEALALLARAARLVGGRDGGGRLLVQTRVPDHEVAAGRRPRRPDPAGRAGAGRPPGRSASRRSGPWPCCGARGPGLRRRPGRAGGRHVSLRTPTAGWCGPPTTPRCATGWPRCPARRAAAGRGRPHRRLTARGRPAPAAAARQPPRTMGACPRTPSASMATLCSSRWPARSTTSTGRWSRLVDDMVETMYEAVGAGLAAPQVGRPEAALRLRRRRRARGHHQPDIVESSGEWYHDEGCLSIPGLRLGIVRPDRVHLRGSTSTATSSPSRPTSSWAGCSSTRSTTSTACSWSSGSTTRCASRRSGCSATGPWASTPRPWRPSWCRPAANREV